MPALHGPKPRDAPRMRGHDRYLMGKILPTWAALVVELCQSGRWPPAAVDRSPGGRRPPPSRSPGGRRPGDRGIDQLPGHRGADRTAVGEAETAVVAHE